jgi:hypothetical protein
MTVRTAEAPHLRRYLHVDCSVCGLTVTTGPAARTEHAATHPGRRVGWTRNSSRKDSTR